MRKRLADSVEARLRRDVLSGFQGGSRSAELRVSISAFVIPSPVHRVLAGGQPSLNATTTLHDSKTGKQLALMKATSAGYAGGGLIGVAVDQMFSDMDDRVLSQYTSQVHAWLKNRQ